MTQRCRDDGTRSLGRRFPVIVCVIYCLFAWSSASFYLAEGALRPSTIENIASDASACRRLLYRAAFPAFLPPRLSDESACQMGDTATPAVVIDRLRESTMAVLPFSSPCLALLCHAGYLASLQHKKIQAPDWVAFAITPNQSRTAKLNDFPRPAWELNAALLPSEQFPLSNVLWDGAGTFDKGHLCPKEIMDWDRAAVAATFDVTNVVPQLDHCNRGKWAQLEENIRTWLANRNANSAPPWLDADSAAILHVVVGTAHANRSAVNVTEGIAVPDFMWTALCDPVSRKSVAFVAKSSATDCGGTVPFYRPVSVVCRLARIPFIFHPDCGPCDGPVASNAIAHWNFSGYAVATQARNDQLLGLVVDAAPASSVLCDLAATPSLTATVVPTVVGTNSTPTVGTSTSSSLGPTTTTTTAVNATATLSAPPGRTAAVFDSSHGHPDAVVKRQRQLVLRSGSP